MRWRRRRRLVVDPKLSGIPSPLNRLTPDHRPWSLKPVASETRLAARCGPWKPFDEESLREAILSVWGEYGAHMDIYDSLLRRLRECAKIPTLTGDMVKAAREDARWSGYPMPSVVMACALQAALDTLHHSSSDTLTRDFPL